MVTRTRQNVTRHTLSCICHKSAAPSCERGGGESRRLGVTAIQTAADNLASAEVTEGDERGAFVSADCVYVSVRKCTLLKGKFPSDLSPFDCSFQWKAVKYQITNTHEPGCTTGAGKP
jgi:hypothetical protein